METFDGGKEKSWDAYQNCVVASSFNPVVCFVRENKNRGGAVMVKCSSLIKFNYRSYNLTGYI